MAANYESLVRLPSNGVLYGGKIPSEFRIRNMTTREEKKIFGSTIPDIDGVLEDCIIDKPDGFSIDDLTLQDRAELLYKLRVLTFGPDYWVSIKCPHCGATREYKIDLSKADVIYLKEADVEPFEITLPKSGDVLTCKYLRGKDVKEAEKQSKKVAKNSSGQLESEISYVMSLAFQIKEVNGEKLSHLEVYSYLQNMHAFDSRYFQVYLDKKHFGVDQDLVVDCSACGEEIDTVIPLNSEFFRPRIDIE